MKNRLQIGGGKKRLLTALSLSLVVGNALFAQEAWIDVTPEHIVNPSFKDGGTGWSGSNYSANGWDVAEFYDKNGTCSQQINSLKPGSSYKLTVKAFYRFGVNDGGTAHNNGTEEIHSELFAGEQSVLLKSLYSEEKDPDLRNNRNGWPDGKEGTNLYFNKYPDRYVNELEFTVSEGVNFVNIGIRVSEKVSRDWTCFSDFKLYVKSTYTEALTEKIGFVENLLGENSVLAACLKVKAEVNDKLNTYKSYDAITQESVMVAAIDDLNGTIVKLNSLIEKATISNDAMVNASAVKERDMLEVLKNSLGTEISTMENCLKDFSLEDDIVKIDAQTDKLNKETLRVKAWMGMASVLTKTRNLANEIGGLQDDQTYIKVGEDLQNGNLDFYTMSADVEALNLVCRNAMTTDFLAKATSEAPIDMTSFIKNPNVYQAKDKTVVPDGWVIADWGSKDNKEPTTEGFADAELHCGSWSGNNDNSIGKAHYYSEIGGTVNVPDGCYRLEAATYITQQPDAVVLYASTDNVDMVMANFNGNKAVYDQAVGLNDGTTTSLEVQVSGGRLYFGVKGKAIVGGNGQQWLADNFRLYYIGAPDVEPKDIKVSEAGMSTYYSANAFTVPEGLTGGMVTNEDAATVAVDWRYPAGSTVPGRTGVILKGAVGDYKAEYSVANVASPENNLLDGTIEAATIADAGYKYYKLADGEKGLGFYFAVEGGSSIVNGANKAYLALPENEAQEVNFLALDFGTTGITDTALAAEDVRVDVYSISGVLVRSGVKASEALDGLSKGIYIVNGKKILK